MKTKQARTIPVGVVVSCGRFGHELTRGTVTKNNVLQDGLLGFCVLWNDRHYPEWVDHRRAKNIFVPGLRGTRTL